MLLDLLHNFPLWASITSILFAQVVKIPIQFIASRHFNPSLAFSTGGMPSSHSAAVTALATGVFLYVSRNAESLFTLRKGLSN